MEQNDHDLLIEIKTNVKSLADGQSNFLREMRDLNIRVSKLEVKERGDSEKVQSISKDVQQTLANSQRITEAFVEIQNVKEDVGDLKRKSNLWDIANAVGVTIAAALGYSGRNP